MLRNRSIGSSMFAMVLGLVMLTMSGGCKTAAVKEMESSSNLKELWAAVDSYHEAKHAWPGTLEDVRAEVGKTGSFGVIGRGKTFDELMANPITGDKRGYEFAKPDTQATGLVLDSKNIPVILYQLKNGQRDTTLPVAYLDGSVRKIGTPAAY